MRACSLRSGLTAPDERDTGGARACGQSMRRPACLLGYSVLVLVLAGAQGAHAGLQIFGTRVIYPSGAREVSVNVLNQDTGQGAVRLMQAWIDSGKAEENAQSSRAPFLVTPPMARIDGGGGQSLRIMFNGAPLPDDRESLFYLNVLEIPPKPKLTEESRSYLQFAVRTRIKLFYRPQGLSGDPVQAAENLQWRLVADGEGYALECINPSGFTASLAEVRLKGADGGDLGENDTVDVCPPRGKALMPLQGAAAAAAGEKVEYTYINDAGGFVTREAPLAR